MAQKKASTKKTKKGKVSFSTKILVLINIFFVLLLGCSYLATAVSPTKFPPLAFAGLLYPLFLIINLFFVLFWAVFLKKYFLISLIAILLGFSFLKSFISFGGSSKSIMDTTQTVKVMSFNVRLFNLYEDGKDNVTEAVSSAMRLIESEQPDFVLMQEYYSGNKSKTIIADSIIKAGKYKYKNINADNQKSNIPHFGLAFFSRYPIVKTKEINFKNSNIHCAVYNDIVIENDTLRVINVHLESIKLGKEDYEFVSDIKSGNTNEQIKKKSRSIYTKLNKAFLNRVPQIETIEKEIKESPYTVILAGDFNDTPVSYSYKKITKHLDDSFAKAGRAIGQTYAEKIPFQRIDYIFNSKSLTPVNFKVIDKTTSDHYPIVVEFLR